VLARDYLDCGPRRWPRTFRHLLADPIERKLPHLHVPTVVARGSRDPTVPHGWAREVVALLPDGHLVEVAGAGRTLNYSAPRALANIVRPLIPDAARVKHGDACRRTVSIQAVSRANV
jgi:pimeloyl-ACP methyl ester carboxylesterase